MSAQFRGTRPVAAGLAAAGAAPTIRRMTVFDLDAVLSIEQRAYSFPWSRGNFIDSLASGYGAWVLETPRPVEGPRPVVAEPPRLLGYYLAMPGVEELHLLNITVAPDCQGQGHGRWMLGHLQQQAVAQSAPTLWLEVRAHNLRAQALYLRCGFETVGRRKAYYPAGQGQREDALVMRKALAQAVDPAVEGSA